MVGSEMQCESMDIENNGPPNKKARHVKCHLCKLSGTEDDKMKRCMQTIHDYILDSVGTVTNEEIAEQISSLFLEQMHLNVPALEILTHMDEHMLHQKVVMTKILKHLIYLTKLTQNGCVTHNEEGNPVVDVKMMQSYLKIVEQITAIYRSGTLMRQDISAS